MPGKNQRGIWKRKTYEVVKATRREDFKGVDVGGRKLNFGRLGNFRVSDPGVAREIEKRWGSYTNGATKEVVVAEVEHKWDFERDHNYTFSMPALPWARYCDVCGKRVEDGSKACKTHRGVHSGGMLPPDPRGGDV